MNKTELSIMDQQDYTLIMDCLADMSEIGTQVLTDVINDIQAELNSRIEHVVNEPVIDLPEESRSDIASRENAIIDNQERR